jgi:cardiolipin synthase
MRKGTRGLSAGGLIRTLLLLGASLAAGCASLPELPHVADTPPADVRVAGARGPLSRAESDAVLQRLAKEARGADIIERHVALDEALVGRPLVAGNRVTLLEDGPATYKAMFDAIAAARDHINLETYIFEDDETGQRFADMLVARQAAGVQVNIIYDSAGTFATPKTFFDRLRRAGIRVLEFNPVNPLRARAGWTPNYRDHRKLLVVDGRVAFLGGINISDVYSSGSAPGGSSRPRAARTLPVPKVPPADPAGDGPQDPRARPADPAKEAPWRDTHVRIEGPVVAEFQKLFLDTWQRQQGEALPMKRYMPTAQKRGAEIVRAVAGSAKDAYSEIYVTLVSALRHAERTAYITMAYFVPDPQLLAALGAAAQRGVDVKLVLPSFSDFWPVLYAGRSHYDELLRSGVKIFERQQALLHAKTVVIDGVWSTVGSSNMDPRSFAHNDEINAVVLGAEFARQMTAMFERDLSLSAPITLDSWRSRPVSSRMKEFVARWWRYWL